MSAVQETQPPRLIRVKEAARLLGQSSWSTYSMIARGVLPAYRLGPKKIRVSLEDIEAFLRARRVEAKQ